MSTGPSTPAKTLENTSEKPEEQAQHVQFMENQSHVLDEVDQLVELMSAEKNTLTEKISTLETELAEVRRDKSVLEESSHKLHTDYNTAKQQLQQLEEKQTQACASLREALEKAQEELKEARSKAQSLTSSLSQKEKECIKIHASYIELKRKVKHVNGEHTSTHTALELQCRENIKLSERCKVLTSENATLASKMESVQQKCKYSQDEVLALKGRLTMSKKTQEQLLEKNSTLEKALEAAKTRSPTIVKVSTRSREELRLAAECKRKDELLARYVEEFSQSQYKQQILQQNIQKLKRALCAEREERASLCASLEANKHESEAIQKVLRKKLEHCNEKIETQEKEALTFSSTREELVRQLCAIEGELKDARREMSDLKREVEERDTKAVREMKRLEQEGGHSEELIKSSREMIENLSKELESTRAQHEESVKQLNSQWEDQLREAREDYRRMKEASTRRCTELAKEVWILKSSRHQETSTQQ